MKYRQTTERQSTRVVFCPCAPTSKMIKWMMTSGGMTSKNIKRTGRDKTLIGKVLPI